MVAGEDKLLSKRKKVDKIVPNNIAVTPAIGLKAKYTIHTVGLAWQGGKKNEFEVLSNCKFKSHDKALELGCESIAFPLIATGTYLSHPGHQDYSWVGRNNDEYCYDYCFVSENISSMVNRCDYIHETRKIKLTDHSAISVEIRN